MSKIVETMIAAHEAAFAESCFDGGADHDTVAFRAALRVVKPSDISDEMVEAACNAIHPARWADKRHEEMRRAIAAAIAAGA